MSSEVDTFLELTIAANPSEGGFVERYFGVLSTFRPGIILTEDKIIIEKYLKQIKSFIVVVC